MLALLPQLVLLYCEYHKCVAAVVPSGWCCCCCSPVGVSLEDTSPAFELSMEGDVMGLNICSKFPMIMQFLSH